MAIARFLLICFALLRRVRVVAWWLGVLAVSVVAVFTATPAATARTSAAVAVPADPARPIFTTPQGPSVRAPEGHLTLRWRVPKTSQPAGVRFELQQAIDAGFRQARTRYRGADRACFLSGLPEGDAFFRVRTLGPHAAPGPWSRPVRVQVRYVSTGLVRGLMLLGAVLLLATLAVIFTGQRRAGAAARAAKAPDA